MDGPPATPHPTPYRADEAELRNLALLAPSEKACFALIPAGPTIPHDVTLGRALLIGLARQSLAERCIEVVTTPSHAAGVKKIGANAAGVNAK